MEADAPERDSLRKRKKPKTALSESQIDYGKRQG